MRLWKLSTAQSSIDAGRAGTAIYVEANEAQDAAQIMATFAGVYLSMSMFDIVDCGEWERVEEE